MVIPLKTQSIIVQPNGSKFIRDDKTGIERMVFTGSADDELIDKILQFREAAPWNR